MYVEDGVRCRRSASGDPPLCHPHRLVAADAGRPPPAFGDGVRNLVDRVIHGKRVTPKMWEGALGDLAAFAAGMAAQAQQQQHTPHAPPGHGQGTPPPRRPSWWPPRPPPDPRIEERRRARIVLGFPPQGAITLEVVQQRRRELARKHHPDRGGSVTKMQAVNAAADVLEAELAERSPTP